VSEFEHRYLHAESIQKNYKYLLAQLEVNRSGLLDQLYEDGVINETEKESISSQAPSHEQNRMLLHLLTRKPKDHFDRFLDALDSTGQHYVRTQIDDRTATAE